MVACIPKDRPGFDAVGPARRLDAVVSAADATDDQSLRGLIQSLDSDDPAGRLLAITALEKRTGQTLGYRYTDPPWLRDQAVARWVQWERARLGGNGSGGDGSAGSPAQATTEGP